MFLSGPLSSWKGWARSPVPFAFLIFSETFHPQQGRYQSFRIPGYQSLPAMWAKVGNRQTLTEAETRNSGHSRILTGSCHWLELFLVVLVQNTCMDCVWTHLYGPQLHVSFQDLREMALFSGTSHHLHGAGPGGRFLRNPTVLRPWMLRSRKKKGWGFSCRLEGRTCTGQGRWAGAPWGLWGGLEWYQ